MRTTFLLVCLTVLLLGSVSVQGLPSVGSKVDARVGGSVVSSVVGSLHVRERRGAGGKVSRKKRCLVVDGKRAGC